MSGCTQKEEVKEETKNGISKTLSEEDIVYEALNGKNLKDNFESSESYSSLNFYDEGEFDGDFLSDSDIDGKDYGLREVSEETYHRSEIHKSVFSGRFSLGPRISDGIYKLDLVDFTINNEIGPDVEIKYQSWVDFAHGLSEGDEYILYLKGARLDPYLLENNQYKLEDLKNYDDHESSDKDNNDYGEDYMAYDIIIYNKTKKLVLTPHDKWALTQY